MHCHKCGKEIKRGSTFCKYCGTRQCSVLTKTFHVIKKGARRSERIIVKHIAVIVVSLLIVIIALQIISIITRREVTTHKESPSMSYPRDRYYRSIRR